MEFLFKALIIRLLSTWRCCALGFESEEPVCLSKYDYDHKLLQKLLLMEIEQKRIRDKNEEQAQEIKSLKTQLNEEDRSRKVLEKRIEQLETVASLDGTGSTYVRWGRTTCPGNGTELVYKGFAGGSQHNVGVSSDYLCLPEDPTWNAYEDAEQTCGTVWGAEYQLVRNNIEKFFGRELLEKDVPCCVCHTKRATTLMIPGRNICYSGWTLEYQGYLITEYDGHKSSEYVCLDEAPETLAGGSTNENGKLFYFAEARCGSLRCPPYVNGRELTCAMCSK